MLADRPLIQRNTLTICVGIGKKIELLYKSMTYKGQLDVFLVDFWPKRLYNIYIKQ
jgi:hypothetical protein